MSRQLAFALTPTFLQSYFAAAAARELKSRENHYPAMVKDGAITRDESEADLAAWRVIRELIEHGAALTPLSWADLEHATSKALLRREADLEADPKNAKLLARRDAVWGIHERISWQRQARLVAPARRAAA
jgi:hypothetical protein